MLAPKESHLCDILSFLFGGKDDWGLVRDLAVPPMIPSHCNQVLEAPYFLSVDRFGGKEDVPLIPLMRRVVDESLGAFSSFFPSLRDYLGRSPISPHGSMSFSIHQWGSIDWDYVRDIDWRLYLPPQIGHESGFLSYLHNALDREIRRVGLSTIYRGKDPDGRPQVQLRDTRSGAAHGFHLYLLAMEPHFVSRSLHEGGGYTIHQTYFPEDSMDPYLEAEGVLWDDVIRRQREHYEEMFQRISFNTFAGDDPVSNRLKTRGWYSKKAFKWYAVLANVRGLSALEDEILQQYHSFQGTHVDLIYLIRRHYFALLDPGSSEKRRLERELSFALSLAYSRGRSPEGDPLIGQETPGDGARILILEPVPTRWVDNVIQFLSQERLKAAPLPDTALATLRQLSCQGRLRFADGAGKTGFFSLPRGEEGILVPSVWSFVFTQTYLQWAAKAARQAGHHYEVGDLHQALLALSASQLLEAILEKYSHQH